MIKLIFRCPMDQLHVLNSIEKFKNHIIKCRLCAGKTFYFCRFLYSHMFESEGKN